MASGNPSPGFDPSQWQPPTPQELELMLPKYHLASLVGRGGMGAVYLGRQAALDRPVAIKILPPGLEQVDPAYGARFRQEAMSLAKLNHPGIVAVYDFGRTEQGLLYIVMEYVEGTDVARMMEQQGRVRSKDAMAITAHVCDALAYAHARGIIHRDIKPANILIGTNGVVKVADFGLAKAWLSGATSLTMSGHAMGTPDYIAPEALLADGSVDARADVYAVGVMLYHMLTGVLPRGVFEPASKKIEGLDPRFDAIIAQSLKYEPAQRYPGVDAMRRDLDAILTTPVVKVDPAAASAPAALNTVPQPRRQAPPAPRQPSRRPPPRQDFDWGFWLPVGSVVIGLAAFFLWMKWPNAMRQKLSQIEGENLPVIEASGGEAKARDDIKDFRQALWSGGAHLWWMKGKKGDRLRLKLPVDEAGKQRLRLQLPVAPDAGIVDISLDGRKLPGSPFDLRAEKITLAGMTDGGVWELEKGDHELALEIIGTRGVAGPFGDACAGIDRVLLEPPDLSPPVEEPGTNLATAARPSASHCWSGDDVRHLNTSPVYSDRHSNDVTKPRFTWHDLKGGLEWVQYEWDAPRLIGESRVFWYDDRGERGGQCGLPEYWRLLYREESTSAWVPVETLFPPARRSEWSVVTFPAVRTRALRIAVQCTEGWSAGICHWQVFAPATLPISPPAKKLPPLFLGDLSPTDVIGGWGRYRANHYGGTDARDGRGVFVGGKPCFQYLWAHANTRLDFTLPEGYTRFTATGIGPSDMTTGLPVMNSGSWTYQALLDGQEVFLSKRLDTVPSREIPLAITIPPGTRRLTLITDVCGSGYGDHAFWAYPTLHADAQAKSLPTGQAPPLDTTHDLPKATRIHLSESTSQYLLMEQPDRLVQSSTDATRFDVVPGLADPTLVSLRVWGRQGMYLRHYRGVIYVGQRKTSATDPLFEKDATWRIIRQSGGGVRFESLNYPGEFITAKTDGTFIKQASPAAAQSTFKLEP
ncbi:MAG: protein kinase [Verrucomicrobiaceae bacterium]|nr:protein kinase [Verrucomicrobiaceae bacterium]